MAEQFDFVVIGAGSSGGTVADLLTRGGRHKVLVLEAGGTHKRAAVDIPVACTRLLRDPRYSWAFETEPEPWARGRRIALPRGRVLGGTSSINGMLYVRGDQADYNSWADLGARGWAWQDLLPYFVRTEDQRETRLRRNSPLHGRGGILRAADPTTVHPVSRAMVDSAVNAGLPYAADFNDGHPSGAGIYQVNIRRGRRWSVARAAIEPALLRQNIAIREHSLVIRIELTGGRATSVIWRSDDGGEHRATASCEIILCAGSIQSPKLLMLSGIGPARALRPLGIDVESDLAGVGSNLQDQAIVSVWWRLRAGVPSLNGAYHGLSLISSALAYWLFGRGPLTMAAAQFGAWLSSGDHLPYNDIQLHGMAASGDMRTFLKGRRGFTTHKFPGATIAAYQVRPYSRGQIRLRDASYRTPPQIMMNYLTDSRDRVALLRGVQLVRHIARVPPFCDLIASEGSPGSNVCSDNDLLDWIRESFGSAHHECGSCRMGAVGDPATVVDSELRVQGVRGLRVADASVAPHLISGNTNAMAVAIGAKAADLVDKSWTRT